MNRSIYEFRKEDARRFATEMGHRARQHGNELQFEICPYCRGGQKPDRNTFSINLDSGKFICLRAGCGIKGNMITLAKDFDFELSEDVSRYLEAGRWSRARFRRFQKVDRIESKQGAIDYLESRGISKATCERYEITTKTNDESTIVFPFRDEAGEIVMVKYRNTDNEKIAKYGKEYCERDCKPILFGMHQCNQVNKTLILTEGQIDSLTVAECGIENAVSVPTGAKGFTWIPHCWEWLQGFGKIIVFGDYEKGEISLLDTIKRRFRQSKQIYHVRQEDYRDCKDANDLLRKYGKQKVIDCINNAIPIPVSCLVDIADVEDVDTEQITRIPTGIHPLDRLLDGGIATGFVTLLNGRTGEGKSTLSNQTILSAVEAGHKVMIYSGEMSQQAVKEQITMQAAGGEFVETYLNGYGKEKSRVMDFAKRRINNWLRGKVWLYDGAAAQEGEEYGEITKVVENAIQQYGVDYIIVDNLMTAIDLQPKTSEAKYDRQGDFVNQLARIALDYGVAILLIAHRRKSQGFATNENDEVLGSSQVTNLVGLNIFYGKETDVKKIESLGITQDQRMIRVTKNRLTGECNFDGILVDYDARSNRIYRQGKYSNQNTVFGWAKDEDDFTEIGGDAEQWEIPF